jgi:DnaJ domain
MNYKDACINLGLDNLQSWTEQDLKRQYRRYALQYHPDKNKTPEATENFHKVQESYEFLIKYRDLYQNQENPNIYSECGDDINASYINILYSFLQPILRSDNYQEIKTRIIHIIVEYIATKCEPKALDLLKRLNKTMFFKIRELLRTYQDVFYFSETFLDKVDEIYSNKIQDECIILNPSIDDLFSNNLYRLVEPGGTFLVPLWHHELVYDNSGSDLYVRCLPILPENIEIDENNDIHVLLDLSLDKVWSMDSIYFNLGLQTFSIPRSDLFIRTHQKVVLHGMGISQINTKDIYNISKKGNIVAHIRMTNENT